MIIEHTDRGFAVAAFTDMRGAACSLQDSSIATDACVWLGLSRHADGTAGMRMHLTRRMAGRIADALRRIGTGEASAFSFEDRNDCECLVRPLSGGGAEMGVVAGADTDNGPSLMAIDADACRALTALIEAFVAGGSIESEASCDDDGAARDEMDVKIPPSMIHRTEVGGTGLSARDLVDALLDMLDGHSLGTLREQVGHDRAVDLMGMARDLAALRKA